MTALTIDAPGLYADVAEDLYHRDVVLAPTLGRSLSSTGAKTILDSPARFAYQREHPVTSDAFDFGTAAHTMLLGSGPEIVAVIHDSWRTKAAQEEREYVRKSGKVPVLAADYDRALDLVDAVLAHPVAGAIFRANGKAEQSLYWIDDETGVTCRGRIDWIHPPTTKLPHGYLVDFKSAANASPAKFSRALVDYGYALQAAWYSDGYEAVTGERLPFVHVVVEKEPPYLVAVYQLDDEALAYGREQGAQARRLFAECESSGEWPGYPSEVVSVSLPAWAR